MRANYHFGKHIALLEQGKEEEAKEQFKYFEAFNKKLD
jgi:hypothetical protein